MTAKATWKLLRSDGHASDDLEIRTIPTDVATSSGTVRLALSSKGYARVLLPLGEREALPKLRATEALSVSVSMLTYKGKVTRFIDLTCLSKELEAVFGEVVDEMLARVAGGTASISAIESTIDDFRSLLMRPPENELSSSVVVGLVGELLILNRLLDISSSAWQAWSGPLGNRHDFRHDGTSLEIKTTTQASNPSVKINGLEQLQTPTNGSLHLLRLVLEPVFGGALTISTLAKNALQKADDPGKVLDLLAKIGCSDFDNPRWNGQSYRLQAEDLYEIRDDFPRFTSSMLSNGAPPAGVIDITYSVDLSLASRFLSPDGIYRKVERSLANVQK